MFTRLPATLGLFAAALTLAALPGYAQTPATGKAAYPKQFQIAPSYVLATDASYDKAMRQLKPGPDHDALLMAALIKNGAHLTPGPQVVTTDGVSSDVTWKSSSGSLGLAAQTRSNADGSVTVQLKIHSDAAALGLPLPASGAIKLQTLRTFQDKQTLLIGGTKTIDSATKDKAELLVFVRVSPPEPR